MLSPVTGVVIGVSVAVVVTTVGVEDVGVRVVVIVGRELVKVEATEVKIDGDEVV